MNVRDQDHDGAASGNDAARAFFGRRKGHKLRAHQAECHA